MAPCYSWTADHSTWAAGVSDSVSENGVLASRVPARCAQTIMKSSVCHTGSKFSRQPSRQETTTEIDEQFKRFGQMRSAADTEVCPVSKCSSCSDSNQPIELRTHRFVHHSVTCCNESGEQSTATQLLGGEQGHSFYGGEQSSKVADKRTVFGRNATRGVRFPVGADSA